MDRPSALLLSLVLLTAIHITDAAVDRVFPGKETKRLKEEYEARLHEMSKILTWHLPASIWKNYSQG